MSLRKTDSIVSYSASAAIGLTYSSFAMSTVVLRTYPPPQSSVRRIPAVTTATTVANPSLLVDQPDSKSPSCSSCRRGFLKQGLDLGESRDAADGPWAGAAQGGGQVGETQHVLRAVAAEQ